MLPDFSNITHFDQFYEIFSLPASQGSEGGVVVVGWGGGWNHMQQKASLFLFELEEMYFISICQIW